MKRPVAVVLLVSLMAVGCGPSNQDATAPTPGPPRPGEAAEEVPKMPFVRVAELEIDPAQLDRYTAAVKEEMEESVRIEPGVLAIYAVAERDSPTKLRFFELYADEAAYKAHIASPHFQKYAATTKPMIVSRKLIDTVPVQLSEKPK